MDTARDLLPACAPARPSSVPPAAQDGPAPGVVVVAPGWAADPPSPPAARPDGLDALRALIPPGGQAELARRAGLGRAYVCDLLAGRRPLTLELAWRLAGALGVHASTLDCRLASVIPPAPAPERV